MQDSAIRPRLEQAAREYERRGHADQAGRLRREVAVLRACLGWDG